MKSSFEIELLIKRQCKLSFYMNRNEPMFLFWINLAIIGCFKSYPAVGDVALQMSLVPLIYEAVKGKRSILGLTIKKTNIFL